MERTFLMVKPDAVHRGLIGKVIARLEQKGLKLIGLKMLHIDKQLAEKLYDVHRERDFFSILVNFVTSGPIVVTVWEGDNAISVVRTVIGATKSYEALPGTIRGDFGLSLTMNIVHASDSPERAGYEMRLFFSEEELVKYTKPDVEWLKND